MNNRTLISYFHFLLLIPLAALLVLSINNGAHWWTMATWFTVAVNLGLGIYHYGQSKLTP